MQKFVLFSIVEYETLHELNKIDNNEIRKGTVQ